MGLRTYYLTLEVKSVAYDFTVDVSAAYPKKVPVTAYIPDKPAVSSEGEETPAAASLSLFINVYQCLVQELKLFIHAKMYRASWRNATIQSPFRTPPSFYFGKCRI